MIQEVGRCIVGNKLMKLGATVNYPHKNAEKILTCYGKTVEFPFAKQIFLDETKANEHIVMETSIKPHKQNFGQTIRQPTGKVLLTPKVLQILFIRVSEVGHGEDAM